MDKATPPDASGLTKPDSSGLRSLSNLFQVTGRFRRSVHLERDFYTQNALDGYVVTVAVRETLQRINDALTNGATSRAWSLTGPYGSGKSAFALYTAKLLGNTNDTTTLKAHDLLKRGDRFLWERFVGNGTPPFAQQGFCPVLISGERSPITLALLRGLVRGLDFFYEPASPPKGLSALKKRLKAAENGTLPEASEMTDLFESATHQICKDEGAGMLLVVDELGKFLEYAAQNPSRVALNPNLIGSDVFVLQSLAEYAARSGETPLLMLTILHQAFEQYAQRLAAEEREEWAKVGGRFENVAFVEQTEQVLRLIACAIERTEDVKSISRRGNAKARQAIELGLKPRPLQDTEFVALLEASLPLHPTVALVLGPLFHRYAQNQRSLFAFLNSSEPHGLSDFLSNHTYDSSILPLLTLSNLYDYIYTALGGSLYMSVNGKRWAEIESAIERLPNPSKMEVKLIKTIGMLGAVGEVVGNLKASRALLHFALDDSTEEFGAEFETALAALERRSIAIYRRYSDTYALWEGSDIDIEAQLVTAAAHIDPNQRLATYLSAHLQPRPLVARRHLFETGTTRFFVVRYTDWGGFDTDVNQGLDNADGLLLYALPTDAVDAFRLVEKATAGTVAMRKEVLIAIPRSIGFLRDAIVELARLRWVEEKTPQFASDATARRELSARIVEAARIASEQMTAIFGTGAVERSEIHQRGEAGCVWYHAGQPIDVRSRRELNERLSAICDAIYSKTPVLRSELINRRQLSAAASTARKKLLAAMLEHGDEKALGIKGYPPEKSIYRSLLSDTGIHRSVSGVWGFHPPQKSDDNRMYLVWEAIEAFLTECEAQRQSVAQLYQRLEKPPIGLRSGPLPLLLCAAMLHYDAEIALYEAGSFVPDVSITVFERLLKAPEKFALKRFRIVGDRAAAFDEFLSLFVQQQKSPTDRPNLLSVIKPLARFINRLPRYALLTQDLSEVAVNVRTVIQSATEPDTLLFEELPKACGVGAPFEGNLFENRKMVEPFFTGLRGALSELNRAYDDLLDWIKARMISAFALKGSDDETRGELLKRAEPLIELIVESRLKVLLMRVCDDGLDFTGWLEAIGTYVTNKPPSSWNDSDKAHFKIDLSELSRKFHHFEALWFELQTADDDFDESRGTAIRVGITVAKQGEQERVIRLHSTEERQAATLEGKIERVFESMEQPADVEFRLAVLARLSQKLMERLEE